MQIYISYYTSFVQLLYRRNFTSVGIYFYESRGQMKILPRQRECNIMYCTDISVIRDLFYTYCYKYRFKYVFQNFLANR